MPSPRVPSLLLAAALAAVLPSLVISLLAFHATTSLALKNAALADQLAYTNDALLGIRLSVDALGRGGKVTPAPQPGEESTLPGVVVPGSFEEAVPRLPGCGSVFGLVGDMNAFARVLGIAPQLPQDFVVHSVCRDDATGRVAFVAAKENLDAEPFVPDVGRVCDGSCDSVLFGVLNVRTKQLRTFASAHQLGLYAEAFANGCSVDHVLVSGDSSTGLALFCGNGESGGTHTWYRYLFAGDKLDVVHSFGDIRPTASSLLPTFRHQPGDRL
jgi:hypothetical protein